MTPAGKDRDQLLGSIQLGANILPVWMQRTTLTELTQANAVREAAGFKELQEALKLKEPAEKRKKIEAVIQARNMAMTAKGPHDQAESENVLTGALKSVFALSEAYPDLKANQNFLNLQEELSGTEGRIAYARQFYNDTVYRHNTKIESFPAVLVAKRFGFAEREYFEAEGDARGPVQVDFS